MVLSSSLQVLSRFSPGSLQFLFRFSPGSSEVLSRFSPGCLRVLSRFSPGSLQVLLRFSPGSFQFFTNLSPGAHPVLSCFYPVLFYSFLFYWKRTGARKWHTLLNFFPSVIFKLSTKLKDVTANAQAQGNDTHYPIFFSSVIFMRSCVAQERTFLLNKMIFLNWIKLFNKTERCDWKRTGARKSHTLSNFFSSVIFMCSCTAQERTFLLNKMIFFNWNQSF